MKISYQDSSSGFKSGPLGGRGIDREVQLRYIARFDM